MTALGDELMMECAVVAETYGLDPDQMNVILREILEEQLESAV